MTDDLASQLLASVKLQRLQDENDLLLQALRQIALAGRRSKIKSGSRHYYAMSAERAFTMAERVIDHCEGRAPTADPAGKLGAFLSEIMTINYPAGDGAGNG